MRKKAFQALVISMLCMIEALTSKNDTFGLCNALLSIILVMISLWYSLKIDKYFKRKRKQVTN